ncbi:magnesium chelatase subunit D [Tropicimonas sp. S265A]|uniref:magnesium chelatase subunit D n=1 Tax=Tropicimonas sp. S265A TaxID=3415134 RepID=UPI003C7ABC69
MKDLIDTDRDLTWVRAATAVAVLSVDPAALGGLWLRARSGPVRERLLAALRAALPDMKRMPPNIGDDHLFGGIDLSATLSAGRLVRTTGLLGGGRTTLLVPMAERMTPALAARLSQTLDASIGHAVIALDEGAEPDEQIPSSLVDRLGLHLDLEAMPQADCPELTHNPRMSATARARLPRVTLPADAITSLARVAMQLGVDSPRAPVFALRAARALAALDGREVVEEDDLISATELVLAPRATRFPPQEPEDTVEDDPPEAQPDAPQDSSEGDTDHEQTQRLPEEILLQAAKAMLPPDLLARLAAQKAPRRAGAHAGAGASRKGNRRGRPLPSRSGRLDGQSRIDLVATLRAAAPWQKVRRALTPDAPQKVLVRAEDLRLRRFEEKSDRLLIFAVDASGSAALARLAEAKGAVELLLAEAYARRDHVALVAFRGTQADLLLPPTRSLVQTKRRLGALPGGGGTPLASGLKSALELSHQSAGRGMSPTIALLTDGRANIALDGAPDRAAAAADAHSMARALRAQSTPAVVIDMGNRPQPQLRSLAEEMAAPYIPLPRADSHRLSAAVGAAIGT